MKKLLLFTLILITASVKSQNILVDSQTYSPQQLIENVLIGNNCITNVQVTNAVGGNFNGTDRSYGYFDGNNSTFPFQNGIVLSTGKLNNVQGPNTTLSDDNAPNWGGDIDLENSLQESNTTNATILEFDFTSPASQISFRYIFASEEYQEGDSSTCQYSDLFGFLIRPTNSNDDYINIALVPNTETPVKVTTVHPEILGQCDAINEAYFESFNNGTAPINFNGQTKILTATATTIPNETYHVKLVIADEQNYRYDSAVFLEAGSFQLNSDLGPDKILANGNPVCENETITLNAFEAETPTYRWFQDGVEQIGETNATFDVSLAGTYSVEVTLGTGCISTGEIVVEYALNPIVNNTTLIECDSNQDGLTTYNLFNANQNVTNNNQDLSIDRFYTTLANAEAGIDAITTPTAYNNVSALQIVFAKVYNQNTLCSAIAEVTLDISSNTLTLEDYNTCDDTTIDGFTTFNLDSIRTEIEPLIPADYEIIFYETSADALSDINPIQNEYTNTTANTDEIVVKVTTDAGQCYAITELTLNVLFTPQIADNESIIYCINSYPETVTLLGGVLNNSPSNYYYNWFFNGSDTGVTTSFINTNEVGVYTVIITDPNGCSNTRDITLTASNAPIIEDLTYTELTSNNTATVTVSGPGDYEYAIGNEFGFYQDSNSFQNLKPGFYTIYIRDKNGCGSIETSFSILGFPQFFTPNGDTFNDVWKPYGANAEFNGNLKILIFNRYGKLLAETNPIIGWNGSLNGLPLPSDDYWYSITHPNGTEYRGHFSLVR